VVGLERNGHRILTPETTHQLMEGGIAWIVDVKEKIEAFLDHWDGKQY
jgi:hypothetical protein